jgi:hypothetical protein
MSNQRDRSEFTISSNKDTSEIDSFEVLKRSSKLSMRDPKMYQNPMEFSGAWYLKQTLSTKKRCNIARQLIIGKGANPKCPILRLVLVPESFHDQKT